MEEKCFFSRGRIIFPSGSFEGEKLASLEKLFTSKRRFIFPFVQCRGFLDSMEKPLIFFTCHSFAVWCSTVHRKMKKLNYFNSTPQNPISYGRGVGITFRCIRKR